MIARGLDRPQGIATDGSDVFVVEAGKGQLLRVDPQSGVIQLIARGLPIGLPEVPSTLAGVAVGAGGTLYVTSDVENSIWRLQKKK